MENVNRRLKAIYFDWAIHYEGPPPRSLSATFEEYLNLERYTFLGDDQWLKKILAECNLADKAEFDVQMTLIKAKHRIYSDQQQKKREKRARKKRNIYFDYCNKMGILPF